MLEDVHRISRQLLVDLGGNYHNLFDENDIFALVEEHQDEPSDMRIANIMNSIVENYTEKTDRYTKDMFTNPLDAKACVTKVEEENVEWSKAGIASSLLDIKDVDYHSLVQHLSCMFPDTPVDYIWDQAKDLVGKEAAIERFTKQLLDNPLPPSNWAANELLLECECCYAETREQDLVQCPAGHTFCCQCVARATSVAMGDGKTGVQCMTDCREEITWRELGRALEPAVLCKLEQSRQAEEVEAAGLEQLVSCPFCPYQAIMEDSSDKVLVCGNPQCGKESCRQCRRVSHIPLRCEEVPEVEGARKRIEEELSMAMLRQCWKCKKRFYKVEGCNLMTCFCGAKMCYLCKAQVTGSDHFNNGLCSQYSDTVALHRKEVTAAAVKAKDELLLAGDLARVLTVDVAEGKVGLVEQEGIVKK